jgi:hypothetical protein
MRNGGTGSVTVSAIASNDPVFTVDTTGTAMTLTGGQVTTFNVFFAPTAVGMKSGAISVTLQGQTTPATSIMAVGEGVMKTSRSGGGCGIAPTATPIALALLLGCVALALATRRARRR